MSVIQKGGWGGEMNPPSAGPEKILRLKKKAICGLKQSSRVQYENIDSYVADLGLNRAEYEPPCL